MNKLLRLTLFGILGVIVMALAASGCSNKPSPQATTPSPPTFEQKRGDVVKYLQSFNSIENSFADTTTQVVFPKTMNTAADLMAWNAAVTKLLTVCDGAISRLAELRSSSLETSTSTHLQQARSLYQSQRSLLKALQDAIGVGNAAGVVQKLNDLQHTASAVSALNRTTEQLMLQYNISDSEVSYRFRGK